MEKDSLSILLPSIKGTDLGNIWAPTVNVFIVFPINTHLQMKTYLGG